MNYAYYRDCSPRVQGLGAVPMVAFDPWSLAITGAFVGITALIGMFKKRGAQKEAATEIVNEAEPILQKNLAVWQNSEKYQSQQDYAIASFYDVWTSTERFCSNPKLGSAGERCISERQEGGNHPAGDWFRRYLDPIRLDPEVQPDPTFTKQILPSQLQNLFGGGEEAGALPLVLGAALVAVAVVMGGD